MSEDLAKYVTVVGKECFIALGTSENLYCVDCLLSKFGASWALEHADWRVITRNSLKSCTECGTLLENDPCTLEDSPMSYDEWKSTEPSNIDDVDVEREREEAAEREAEQEELEQFCEPHLMPGEWMVAVRDPKPGESVHVLLFECNIPHLALRMAAGIDTVESLGQYTFYKRSDLRFAVADATARVESLRVGLDKAKLAKEMAALLDNPVNNLPF